jgi:hypothetical protein
VSDAAVLVLIRTDPETSHRANEAVRIALGILAGENAVVIALLGPAAKILSGGVEDYVDGEDLLRHLGTLKRLGQPFHVEASERPTGRDANPAGLEIRPLDPDTLARLVRDSRRVLVF